MVLNVANGHRKTCFRELEKTSISLIKVQLNLKFNEMCLKEILLPVDINIYIYTYTYINIYIYTYIVRLNTTVHMPQYAREGALSQSAS